MKAMKAAKAMKAMKAKRISKIAKGKLSKAMVFRGSKERTVSGLNKAALLKNKRGKVVSKKQNAAGKRAYKHIRAGPMPSRRRARSSRCAVSWRSTGRPSR